MSIVVVAGQAHGAPLLRTGTTYTEPQPLHLDPIRIRGQRNSPATTADHRPTRRGSLPRRRPSPRLNWQSNSCRVDVMRRPLLGWLLISMSTAYADPLVIAHRGASGYLPEHTLAAKAMAHQMGADYLEQDVVLSNDGVPIVLHDRHLDAVSDVAEKFPGRSRKDGRYYALDFTLAEIKTLRISERVNPASGKAVFPQRFPVHPPLFSIPTLSEELALVQGLNRTTGKNVGIYTEIKSPRWHRQQGYDISRRVLHVLRHFGYEDGSDSAFVQCFDASETRRMREQLGTKLRLIQLLERDGWQGPGSKADRLAQIAQYADGIGPPLSLIVVGRRGDRLRVSTLTDQAHGLQLLVHPYTLRVDGLPEYVRSYQELVHTLFHVVKVDGIFSDQPDATMAAAD